MKMKLKTLMAGPEGVFRAGSIIERDGKEAKHLIDGGFAEALEPVPAAQAPEKPMPPPLMVDTGEHTAPDDGLELLKMQELKTKGKELGIAQRVGMTKAELIAAIRQAAAR